MTCIAGLIDRTGDVWLGADSASIAGWTASEVRSPKLLAQEAFLLGSAGSWRLLQVLETELPKLARGTLTAERFVVGALIPACRRAIRAAGALQVKDGVEESPGSCLVGMRRRLFVVSPDWGVVEPRCRYAAVGSGAEVALGALHATIGKGPIPRLRAALGAAVAHNIGVRRPFALRWLATHGEIREGTFR